MISERIKELVHADLDGELSAAGRQELEGHLSASAEARQYQSQMAALQAFLDRVPEPEMPERLHASIVDTIRLPASRRRPQFRLGLVPGFVRYGFAAAAGLLLAVGIYEYRPTAAGPGDMGGMVGTVMPGRDQSPGVLVDRYAFELEQLSSEVSLVRRSDALVLEMQLEAGSGVDVTVDFTGEGLQFDAIAQMDSDLESIEVADRAVRIAATGRQYFAVVLHDEAAPADGRQARIRLAWARNGEVLQTRELTTD